MKRISTPRFKVALFLMLALIILAALLRLKHRHFELTRTLGAHSATVTALVFIPNAAILASASGDVIGGSTKRFGDRIGEIMIWDLQDGTCKHKLADTVFGVNDLALSSDSRLLAAACGDGFVRLWSTDNWSEVSAIRACASPVFAVTFAPNADIIAAGGGLPLLPNAGKLGLYDARTFQEIGELGDNALCIKRLQFSPDGTMLISGGTRAYTQGEVVCWRVESKEVIWPVSVPNGITDVTFSPDSDNIAMAYQERFVEVRPLDTTRISMSTDAVADQLISVTYSPDSRFLACGGWSGEVYLWRTLDFGLHVNWNVQEGPVYTLRFSPDGKMLATGGFDKIVRLWNVRQTSK